MRDVASGADRHLDITFGFHVASKAIPCFRTFREAFSHLFSFTSILYSYNII